MPSIVYNGNEVVDMTYQKHDPYAKSKPYDEHTHGRCDIRVPNTLDAAMSSPFELSAECEAMAARWHNIHRQKGAFAVKNGRGLRCDCEPTV